MTMDQPEENGAVGAVLTEALRSHAEHAPSAATLLDALSAKAARRRAGRRRGAVLAVTAAVVAAVGAGFVVAETSGHGGRHGTTAAHTGADTMRTWTYHGLQVKAPSGWGVNALRCGTPVKDTVVIDQGPTAACAIKLPGPMPQTVTFGTLGKRADPSARKVTVDGRPATVHTERMPDGLFRTTLTVPSLDAFVDVRTRSRALTAAVIASARIVSVDTNGCAAHVDALRPGGAPQRSGAAAHLVPGLPSGATVCHYEDHRLAHSTRLTGSRLTELLDQLAALRPGLKPADPRPNPKQPPSVTLGSCFDQADRDGYLLRFTYPSGPALDVYAHFDGCIRLGADNGARTGGLTPAFGDSFFGKVDPGFGGVVAGGLREPVGPVRH
ncbi:hypothetical protein [Actinacidiphila acididurans]|uniref:Uncharacterized protein n=1 Tax=Actinacidiphila acididurans TaxID=2784346 RepID=A0ABS2TT85_9ACTN|nr:hypothetical protein [Actinacidiphila acididurans]MBM9506206.1 hypothetical protein [Actinacidiphila acididurans]